MKKFLVLFVAVLLSSLSLFSLTACQSQNDKDLIAVLQKINDEPKYDVDNGYEYYKFVIEIEGDIYLFEPYGEMDWTGSLWLNRYGLDIKKNKLHFIAYYRNLYETLGWCYLKDIQIVYDTKLLDPTIEEGEEKGEILWQRD